MARLEPHSPVEPMPSVLTVAHVVYALHTVAIVIGIVGAATVIGSFVGSLPSILAVLLNYAKRSSARGTWADSHYRWQIRTFWFALLWATVVFFLGLPLTLVIVGFAVWIVGFFLLGIWAIYRIARGWMALNAGRPIG